MTTVAWDGRFIAADTKGDNGGLVMPAKKIFSTGWFVLGGAGSLNLIIDFFERIKNLSVEQILDAGFGFPPDVESVGDIPSIILAERSSGDAWYLAGRRFIKIDRGFHAIGSGRDFAMAAMALKQTAYQAVELATTLDAYSGGEIDVLEVRNS